MLEGDSLDIQCSESTVREVRQNFELALVFPTFLIHCDETRGERPSVTTHDLVTSNYNQIYCVEQFDWAYPCSHS